MTCKRCHKPPRNGRLPRGLCGACAVATTREGTYDEWSDPDVPNVSLGSRTIDEHGYVRISTSNGSMAEHRFVMEQQLGRRLVKGENVHHINGVRDDNRPENLELWWRPQHAGQRVRDLIKYMAEYHSEAVAKAASQLGEPR